jgi:hypothetical protein
MMLPKTVAISRLKDRMCRVARQEAVEKVIEKSHEKPVLHRLERPVAA